MFVKAIETVAQFTRPIHTISRNYGSKIIHPGAATLFFINADGWALTCRHVAGQIIAAEELGKKHLAFMEELNESLGQKKKKQLLRNLEKKYNYSKHTPLELYNRFMGCVEGYQGLEIKPHNSLDVALIHFLDFTRLLCDAFPTFATNGSELKQGMFLCRLGFPFVEFSNFACDSATDKIHWTDEGRRDTPRFPIEGMVTRHLRNEEGQTIGFELSTPGLRGQSGGPAFDPEGRVWGMQAGTAHLDLNFDVDQEVLRNGAKKRVSDSAFLHVGHCIHVDVLKSFMAHHGVQFQEG